MLRRAFDIFDAETNLPMTWIDVEDGVAPVRLQIKAAYMRRVGLVEPILRVVFRSAGVMSYNMTRLSMQVEVMSILFARRYLPINLVPTGRMLVSSTKIYFTCIDVSKMTTKGVGMFGSGECDRVRPRQDRT